VEERLELNCLMILPS